MFSPGIPQTTFVAVPAPNQYYALSIQNVETNQGNRLEESKQMNCVSICRFCAGQKNNEDLMDLSREPELYRQCIQMLDILKMEFVDILHPLLPKTSCGACYKSLHAAYAFFEQVKHSQAAITSWYNAVDVKEEVADTAIVKIEWEEEDSMVANNDLVDETENATITGSSETSVRHNITVENTESKKKSAVRKSNIQNKKTKSSKTGTKTIAPIPITLVQNNLITDYDSDSSSDSELDSKESHRIYCGIPVFETIQDNNKKTNASPEHIFQNYVQKNQDSYKSSDPDETDQLSHVKNNSLELDVEPNRLRAKLTVDTKSLTDFGATFFENSTLIQIDQDNDESWSSYSWVCLHCHIEFDTMDEVRSHSKELHGKCYSFNCADCDDQFNTFNAFVEHVREHRDKLRLYCQYCNMKFESQTECTAHAITHWANGHKICDLCGEVCADSDVLKRHKKLYKQVTLPRRYYRQRPKLVAPPLTYGGMHVFQPPASSWREYTWTCQECCVREPDADSLRRHAQEFHNKCFAMKCVDCLKVVRNYRTFVTHVTGHRPDLKHYCQYCNTYFEDLTKLSRHVDDHMSSDRKPCDGCGQIFATDTELQQHVKKYDPPRRRGTLTSDDLTCDICHKLCKTASQLRSHKKTHDENRQKEHVCEKCGKAFYSASMLQDHIVIHSTVKTEVCQVCKKEFLTKNKLKAHVLTHMELKFTCDECGKNFRTKHGVKNHLERHMGLKQFECLVCHKRFNYKNNIKSHMNLHTGLRPYSCEHCDRTFGNWANCNKHMLRKHGVTLAKTKLTAQGRVDISKTGKVKKLASDTKAKEWMRQVTEPKKRGKKIVKDNVNNDKK